MKSAPCPICNKHFTESFLPLHAASCGDDVHKSIVKPTRKRHKRPPAQSSFKLQPKYRASVPPGAPESERGAPGFHIFYDVFRDIELELLRDIEKARPVWRDHGFRMTKSYGPVYNLGTRRFMFGRDAPEQLPMPPYVTDIILPRIREQIPMMAAFQPNQVAVALYEAAGGHILPHNDCETGEIKTGVLGVCLGAQCTMTLILRSRESGVGKDVKNDIVLPRGAVYVMTGDALRVWEHAIFPGKTEGTRYSLTFRDVSPRKDELEGFRSPQGGKKRYKQSSLT